MENSTRLKSIRSVIAITEVFQEGQKVIAVAIEYPESINNAKLAKSTFSVEGRTITKVYANTTPAKASKGTDGKYVIIELSRQDKEATTVYENVKNDRYLRRKEVKVKVTQNKEVVTARGKKYLPDSRVMVSNKEINLVADDFLKLEYKDLKSGEVLKYNLFIPKDYDKNKSYPLVVFIDDRGPNCEIVEMPLIQSLGGVIWATPEEQAKHPCFVLAPQYPYQIIFDDYTTTIHADLTIDLINSIVNHYNIDTDRIYSTGQSQGTLLSLELSIRYPDMFAAMLLVSGFWNPVTASVLAHNKMWVILSEGDNSKAFPRMNAIMASLEAAGAKISRSFWDGRQSIEEANAHVKEIIKEGNNIKYTLYKDNTYVTPFDDVEKEMNHVQYHHVHTWKLVYAIEGLRDWLLAQKKDRPALMASGHRVKEGLLLKKP
jgi:predicted peptidase